MDRYTVYTSELNRGNQGVGGCTVANQVTDKARRAGITAGQLEVVHKI